MSFKYRRLKDPAYFAENRLAAHSDHIVYARMEELLRGESSLYCPLDGLWKFFCARNENQIIPGFEGSDYDCHPWADIPVPAHIQLEGYGAPQYGAPPYGAGQYQPPQYTQPPQQNYYQPQYVVPQYNVPPAGYNQKSRLAAGLLGILLGTLGVHNFYLGFTTRGVVQLLVSIIGGIFTCGMATVAIAVWGFVEGVLLLAASPSRMYDGHGVILRD